MKRDKKKNRGLTFNKKVLKTQIMGILKENPQENYNYRQVAAILNIKDNENRALIGVAFAELKEGNLVDEIERGRYRLKSKIRDLIGIIDITTSGEGRLHSDELEEPVSIGHDNLLHAMNGDKVRVSLYARHKKREPEGEVAEIIERAKSTFVGTIEMSKNYAFFIPSGKQNFDIFIAKDKLKGALDGQKAIARIIEWPERAKNPFGEIVEVLGDAGENQTEMHAILAEYDLPLRFPDDVLKEADKISLEISAEEIAKRRDFREAVTFTIDPKDAKDFDDALSIGILPMEIGRSEFILPM